MYLYENMCYCCFYVLVPACPKLFPCLIIVVFLFFLLNISLQAISDAHKMTVILHI